MTDGNKPVLAFEQVSRILFEDWDIAGVNGNPECNDEYDGYAGDILAMLINGTNIKELMDHLAEITEKYFGIQAQPHKNQAAAERLLSLGEPFNTA